LNWYAYCGGDPVNRMDPSGLDYVNVGIGIDGNPDDGAVLWLSDDFGGPSIGGFTKGGKRAIGRLDPSDPSMVILSGGNTSGRVSLAGLQSLARNSHFNGADPQFESGVDLSISSLQLAVASAQQLMAMGPSAAGGDVDPVDEFMTRYAADMAWGPNEALPGLGKELAIGLLTMPGGPVSKALGKAFDVAGDAYSAVRAARAARAATEAKTMASLGTAAGRRVTPEFKEHLAGLLGKDGAILHGGEHGSRLIAETNAGLVAQGKVGNVAAIFRVENGVPKLIIGENASRYEAMHEYFHFLHYKRLGSSPAAWAKVTTIEAEQEVFNAMFRSPLWKNLSRAEREHAENYLRQVGGDPMVPIREWMERFGSGTGGVRLGE